MTKPLRKAALVEVLLAHRPAEARPVEARPAEARPAEARPADREVETGT